MKVSILSFLPPNWKKESSQASGKSSEDKLVGKFVLISSHDSLTLVLGQLKEFKYHAHIVDRFCRMNQIPSGWRRKPDSVEIYDDKYEVTGGGWIEINSRLLTVKFFGHSTAYGSFDRSDVESCLMQSSLFDGFRILIIK